MESSIHDDFVHVFCSHCDRCDLVIWDLAGTVICGLCDRDLTVF